MMKNSAVRDLNGLSVNGLREIIEAKTRQGKTFWVVVFLLCHGATAFYIYRVTQEFLDSGSSSQVKYEEYDIYYFPYVTICTKRWQNLTKMRETGLSLDAINYGLSIFQQNHTVNNPIAARKELTAFLVANNYNSLTSFFANMSVYSREDAVILIEQNFNRRIENAIRSITRDIQMTMCVDVDVGNITQSYVKAWGEFAGRTLMVHIPDEANGTEVNDSTYMILYSRLSDERSAGDQYVYVSLNRRYHVDIIPRQFTSVNYCINKTELPYYRKTCMDNCWREFNKKYEHSGECAGLHLMSVTDEISRGPLAISTYCPGPLVYHDSNVRTYKETNDNCSNQCRPYCGLEVFEVTQSSVVLSTENNGRNLEIILRLSIEHGILTFREVKMYSFDTLVSNVGGVLGLWLGANMFTLIQLGALAWNYASEAYTTGRAVEVSTAEVNIKPKQDLSEAATSIYARLDSFEKIINQMQLQLTHLATLIDKPQVS